MKYELDQLVYYLNENKLHSANVISRMTVDNIREAECNPQQKDFYFAFGPSGTYYRTCHGTFNEKEVFDSKEKLAEYICS
jgi:hypothetical protein